MNPTESDDHHLRVDPDGALILHDKAADDVGLATGGLVPVNNWSTLI